MNERIDFLSPVSGRFLLALLAAAVIAWMAVRFSSGRANRLAKTWPIYLLRGLLIVALLLLLLNPVRVTEQVGSIEPSQVFFLLDASQSMAIGNENATRWDQAVNIIRSASEKAAESAAAELSLFRFGRRLKAIDSPDDMGFDDSVAQDGIGVSYAKAVEKKSAVDDGDEEPHDVALEDGTPASPANEPDTQLFVALRQISSRFGRQPPAAVVVSGDGRARDESQAEQVAAAFKKLGVPVHVIPVGNTESGGDVALVSVVIPRTARKQSEVQAQAFLRSYGFDGQQIELQLNAIDDAGRRTRRLATQPVTLQSGFQSVPVSFRTTSDTELLETTISKLPNEVSTDNNRIETQIEISREKIRVLYVEGSPMRGVPQIVNGQTQTQGRSASSLSNALLQDDDIDCKVVQVSVNMLSSSQTGSFPKSVAELSSFDAIVLSDVPKQTFTDKQLDWIEGWVRRRGGGLCMVGGRNSFGSGEWANSHIEKMLPVQLAGDADWRSEVRVSLQPDLQGAIHPLFRFASDDQRNRAVLNEFPKFMGTNAGLVPKPNLAKVLAVAQTGLAPPEDRPRSPLFTAEGIRNLIVRQQQPDNSTEQPTEFAAITVGQYGKGRTMAMPMQITGNPAEEFLQWGRTEDGNEYYSQFWRNVVYWLTEQSYVGRRRLVANVDKRYYGPGDTITMSGAAFDENANETGTYELLGSIDPQSFDNIESEFSIVRWPNNVPREEETKNPFAYWGEKFRIPAKKVGGRNVYEISLSLAEMLPSGTANQSLRLELTAYEDGTMVDSTSVPIQILYDPFEKQNPFPNHELLATLAEKSGGKVLNDEKAVAKMLTSLPVVRGPSELTKAPIWSNWWTMAALLGLITAEWCYRRFIGLA